MKGPKDKSSTTWDFEEGENEDEDGDEHNDVTAKDPLLNPSISSIHSTPSVDACAERNRKLSEHGSRLSFLNDPVGKTDKEL